MKQQHDERNNQAGSSRASRADRVTRFANRSMQRFWRLAPLVSAGMVFQATGCQINTNEIAAGLLNSILNQLISGFVFGAFNLVGP